MSTIFHDPMFLWNSMCMEGGWKYLMNFRALIDFYKHVVTYSCLLCCFPQISKINLKFSFLHLVNASHHPGTLHFGLWRILRLPHPLVTTMKDHGTAESDGGPRCKLSSRLTSAAAEIKSANLGLQDGRQQEWAREMRQGVQVRVAHSTEECSTTLAGNRLFPAKLVCVFLWLCFSAGAACAPGLLLELKGRGRKVESVIENLPSYESTCARTLLEFA